ncbi:helix-turn-helix transcriptional regulator [Nocardia sp. CDC159]|uniref:Helix-turn-helix transcriptional regulator n=1 Tax=Nocardia pulmonis TaxID=2951408 RepID=A0A9X2EFV6_9NOCA|nr:MULTISPECIES: helix-turn-helix domain-containing protein [Nocardia]MCM6777511.1 helix-turn-helix transcriptional regulator [Nocardia pulmonis]MCM6790382.1 helix-turn-helix transcriptional regulator [Nocardia sp. CDC159]
MSAVLEGPLRDLNKWKPTDCSIVKALDIVGTRSALLILREALYGTTRFDGFAARVGITDAAASAALRKLTDADILRKQPYQEEGKRTRHEYVLTEKGRDLIPVVIALWQWGDKYLQNGVPPLERLEDATGAPIRVEIRSPSGTEVPLEGIRIRLNRAWKQRRPTKPTPTP